MNACRRSFRTILFDLDGTLVDHFAAIHRSHAHTLRQLGLREPSLAEVRGAVGLGLEHAIRTLLGPERVHLLPRAVPIYREYWDRTLLDDVALLPGALELLDALRAAAIPTAVLTNKHGGSARRICDRLDLTSRLTRVIGAEDTPWLKPDPRLMRHAMVELGGEPATSLLVGDSIHDIKAAQNSGVPCWAVTTGTHDRGHLTTAGADAIFDSLREIQTALRGFFEPRMHANPRESSAGR